MPVKVQIENLRSDLNEMSDERKRSANFNASLEKEIKEVEEEREKVRRTEIELSFFLFYFISKYITYIIFRLNLNEQNSLHKSKLFSSTLR